MTDWVRLWHDMPTDPKWRSVARRSGQPITAVLSVFIFMMTNASANANERGELTSWEDEDVAAALDMEIEDVRAITDAMQGKVLDGMKLTGWDKRQPKREDGAAERAKQWRERKRTQANSDKRPEADTDTEISDANASAATSAASAKDYRDLLWTEGAESLARQTGKTIQASKSFIGKCLRDAKDDCRLVLTKIRQAEIDRIGEPASWIAAACRDVSRASSKPSGADLMIETTREMLAARQPSNPNDWRNDPGMTIDVRANHNH
ncbi:hypothetical protein [Aureimonas sp. AU20]|uniref:hypothetical protein n=1 Tax=Aureimonas sp. AU20 TaxID=1349819 RepID=UPI0007212B08|nr:hypothetical protein [Aureimonas sp. AU20]ALN73549.1 hypothetical protein M673_12552 [Aureimonas sp. AU20]